jgi:hypothetical protein
MACVASPSALVGRFLAQSHRDRWDFACLCVLSPRAPPRTPA